MCSINAILSLGNGVKYHYMVAASVSDQPRGDSRIHGHGFSLDQDTLFAWSEQRKQV